MEYRIYNVPTGGAPLWEEFWTGANSVDVSDGLFSVMLGSINTGLTAVVQENTTLYLGITVGTDTEMTPRVQLGSVPFSIWSLTVADNSITSAKIADGAVTTDELADGAVTAAKLAPSAAGNWVMFDDDVVIVPLTGISGTGTDPTWQTVDISEYVSPYATAALISMQSAADGVGVYVQVRPVGSVGGGGELWSTQWVAGSGIWAATNGIVKLNSAGQLQWRAATKTFTITSGAIQLWGYFEPSH